MHWQRLNRETSIKILDSVKSDAHMGMFAIEKSEVKNAPLPFYQSILLYKVTNYASVPSFTFEYLGDGKFFQYIDGTEDPIYAINDKGALELNIYNVVEYLRFFFERVSDDEYPDMQIITNLHDMPLLDSLAPAVFASLAQKHKLPEINHDEEDNSFEIEADLYVDAQLVRATITVSAKGRVAVTNQEMIVHEMNSGMIAPEEAQY
jgi:hypothetical protein